MKRQRPRQAQLDPSGRTPAHQLGMIEISGVRYRLLPLGAWSSSASYVLGNLVTSGGSTYLCVAANTNETPPNATYWQTFDDTTYFLRGDRVWAPAVTSGGPGLLDTILSKNPYLFYKLNEASGSIAHDSSGNGWDLNTGSYAAPTWGDTPGPPGEVCALFTAADGQRLSNPSIPDVSGGGADDFTVICWFKYVGTESVIIGQGTPGRSFGSGWQLGVGGDGFSTQLLFVMHDDSVSGGYWVAGDNPLTSGDWYMGAAVQSAGSQYLYLNGLQQTTVGSYTYSGVSGLWIGNDGEGPPWIEAANGNASYQVVIRRALSGAEILAIYNSGFPNADDGEVFSADGAGGTKWRTVVGVRGATVDVSASEIEIGAGAELVTADPASPVEGELIFDTGTGKLAVWDGTSWWRVLLTDTGVSTYPSIRASSFLGDASSTSSHVISAPTGVANGDVLILFGIFPANPTDPTVTLPAGWTQLWQTKVTGGSGDEFTTVCAWKLASSEPSSYTITTSLSDRAAIKMLAVKDSTAGAVGSNGNNTNGTAGTSFATPSITTTVDGDLIIALMGTYDGTAVAFTPDASFTEYSSDENTGNHARVEVETYDQSIAAAISATATASPAAPISAGIIAVKH